MSRVRQSNCHVRTCWYIIDVNGQTGYVTKSLSAIQ